ncbi:hypothetical protein [Peribacillus frigoritolerans]|uniref:phosphoribosyltransferase-like protein n=1 Tax=Peribacillus frigoritolerans TaxID=450367 RepID=UPI0039A15368
MLRYKELKELLDNIDDKKLKQDYKDFFKFTFHNTFTSDLIDIFGKNKVQEWIEQFEDNKDKDIASEIFSKIQYYDSEAVKNFCKLGFIEWQVKNKTNTEKTLFIPLGLSGKSGQMVGYFFRTANSISESKLKNQVSLTLSDISGFDHIVFLDDFTGTGNQFLRNNTVKFAIRNRASLLASRKKAATLTFISLIATEEAIKNIETNSPIKVIAPHIRRRAYATDDDEFIEFNSKYGSGLFRNRGRDCFLGWGDVGETIIFFYNVPNNTLPILWSGAYSSVTKKNWIPLFNRSGVAGAPGSYRGSNVEIAREFYSILTSSPLYSEDYIIWIDVVKEIYLKTDKNTFNLEEMYKLLSITSNLLVPYDNMFTYYSPLTFLNQIRKDLLSIVDEMVKNNCSENDLIKLLNLFEIDKYSINQGLLIRHEISKIIYQVIGNNPNLIDQIIDIIEADNENIYKIQGVSLAIQMFSKEELEGLLGTRTSKIKNLRDNNDSHSLKLYLEEILAKLENRKKVLTDIDLDKALMHVNYYGKYKILSINTIRSHLGLYL